MLYCFFGDGLKKQNPTLVSRIFVYPEYSYLTCKNIQGRGAEIAPETGDLTSSASTGGRGTGIVSRWTGLDEEA